jgi:hypothetical protein
MGREPARQQRGDRGNVGFFDLTAAQSWRGRSHSHDHDEFVNLIVSVAPLYRAPVNKA